ncbi:UNKNOWN [Stylonychia lemnae]|uniref:A-macroglobulin complement component n=1 Tax=Stylonychia lemnae TaxID=5949 RepID=A0A078B1T5_STYLE|nr:UNKNOWN [Stylonychia lemnae]|eukprot:CDW88464.1 UNKNOWN [Stylonychia lemnae]
MIVLTDLNGISIGKNQQEIAQFNFTRILTNPTSGFTFLLPKNLSDGQYLISVVSHDFPPDDPVLNDYQTIYYYVYVDQNQTGKVTDVPLNFKQAKFGAYVNDGKKPDASVRYIPTRFNIFPDNAFRSYSLISLDKEIYFLEIPINVQMPVQIPFSEDGTAMIGNHYTTSTEYYGWDIYTTSPLNVIRIPVILDGIQTIRKQYQNNMDLQQANYFTIDTLKLKTFNYSRYDSEFGLFFNCSDGIFSLSFRGIAPPLLVLGSFPTLDKLNSYFNSQYQFFSVMTSKTNENNVNSQGLNSIQQSNLTQNNQKIVKKFVTYTIEFLGYLYGQNVTALRFTNNSTNNLNILVGLFPLDSTVNLINAYGLQNAVQSACKLDYFYGEIPSKSLKIGVTFTMFQRIFGANESLRIYFNTSSVAKNSKIYLLSIKNKEKVIFSEMIQLNDNLWGYKKEILASKFQIPNGGILTLNLHRIKQEYFNFDTAIGQKKQPICDYNIIQTMINNGSLPRSILDNSNFSVFHQYFNHDTQTPSSQSQANYEPFQYSQSDIYQTYLIKLGNNSQCIHITLNSLVQFTEFIGAISFFKKAQTNTTRAEIKQMRDNYVPGDLFNTTIKSNINGSYSIIVTEDKPNDSLLIPNLTYQAYFKNEIDENTLGFLNPQNITLQYFGEKVPADNTTYIEEMIALQAWRQLVFEPSMIQAMQLGIMNMQQNQQFFQLNMLSVSKIYGFNFFKDLSMNDQLQIQRQFETVPKIRNVPPSFYNKRNNNTLKYYGSNTFSQQAYSHNTLALLNQNVSSDRTDILYYGYNMAFNTTNSSNFKFYLNNYQSVLRMTINYYGPNGFSTSIRKIKIRSPLFIQNPLPKVMVMGDTFNVTVNFANYQTQDQMAFPYVAYQDDSLNCTLPNITKTINNIKTNSTSFIALANKNSSYQYSVKTSKISKQSKHIISFVVTRNQSFEQYEASIEQSTKILPIGTRKFVNSAGIIQLNQSSYIQDAIQFTVLMADVFQYNTTFVEVVILPSFEAQLKQTLSNLAKKKIETADDIVVQLELLNHLIDIQNQSALSQNNIVQNIGVITESITRAKYLYNQLNSFTPTSTPDGHTIGYDYLGNKTEINLPLSALTINVLKQLTFLGNYQNMNNKYSSVFEIIQKNRDKNGNYNLGSTNIAISAPQNVSNAFILYSIKEVEKVYSNQLLNISNELQILIKTVNKTCNLSAKFDDLRSDPVQLALTYLAAFNYSDSKIVQLQNLTDLIFKQLLKHQKNSGEFDSPVNQTQYQYSILNGQNNSRVIEATALGVIAMISTNKSLYEQNITQAINYLLKQSNQGMFGGNLGTILTFRALKLYAYNHSTLGSDVQFILQGPGIKNKIAKFKTYSDPIKFTLNSFDFNPALKVVPITVSMGGSGLLKKDLGLAYYTVYSNIDNRYEGYNQTNAQLKFSVAPSTSSNLSTIKEGSTVTYQVYLQNLNKIKSQSIIKVTFPYPTCLNLKSDSLNSFKISQGTYKINNEESEINLFIRGLKPQEIFQLSIPFTMKGGYVNCQKRVSYAQILNNGQIVSSRDFSF